MTPHIEAKEEDIAKVVIMPGDPIRAKLIAEKYLSDYRQVNNVRGMLAFTGKYKGKDITIFSCGMGIPSMGIYSYELFKFYNVEKIIKIGTCGSYVKNIPLNSILLVDSAYSESTYAKVQDNIDDSIMYASNDLNNKIEEVAGRLDKKVLLSDIHCVDVFYENKDTYHRIYDEHGCVACEMESFSLFHNANKFNKAAAELLTVTDNLITEERLGSADRQGKVMEMVEIALESAILL